MDLSRPEGTAPLKPHLHPESKVDSEAINFEIDDTQSRMLAFNMQYNSQKKREENDEVKIDAIKYIDNDKHAELNDELSSGYSPVPKGSSHKKGLSRAFETSEKQHKDKSLLNESTTSGPTISLTEKKLNNYLHQAQYIINKNLGKDSQSNSTGFAGASTRDIFQMTNSIS